MPQVVSLLQSFLVIDADAPVFVDIIVNFHFQ